MGVRRIVTGHLPDGSEEFVSDEQIEGVAPALLRGIEVTPLWGSDDVTRIPNDGSRPHGGQWFPGPGGYRVSTWTIPASGDETPVPEDIDAAVADAESLLPGLTGVHTDNGKMHAAPIVDIHFVIEGTVILQLENGTEREIPTGSLVVQNATSHQWLNRDPEQPVRMVSFFFGAERP